MKNQYQYRLQYQYSTSTITYSSTTISTSTRTNMSIRNSISTSITITTIISTSIRAKIVDQASVKRYQSSAHVNKNPGRFHLFWNWKCFHVKRLDCFFLLWLLILLCLRFIHYSVYCVYSVSDFCVKQLNCDSLQRWVWILRWVWISECRRVQCRIGTENVAPCHLWLIKCVC